MAGRWAEGGGWDTGEGPPGTPGPLWLLLAAAGRAHLAPSIPHHHTPAPGQTRLAAWRLMSPHLQLPHKLPQVLPLLPRRTPPRAARRRRLLRRAPPAPLRLQQRAQLGGGGGRGGGLVAQGIHSGLQGGPAGSPGGTEPLPVTVIREQAGGWLVAILIRLPSVSTGGGPLYSPVEGTQARGCNRTCSSAQ